MPTNSSLENGLDTQTNSRETSTKKKVNGNKSAKSTSIETKSSTKKQIVENGKPATKKAVKKSVAANTSTIVVFQLKFKTQYGQNLFITGDHAVLGSNKLEAALPMQYFNDEIWIASIELENISTEKITYNYLLKNADGNVILDWGKDKFIDIHSLQTKEILIIDSWNFAGYYENAFYTEPFQQVLLKNSFTSAKQPKQKNATHIFKIKAPLLKEGQTVCLLGAGKSLQNWDTKNPVQMYRKAEEDFFTATVDLSGEHFPVAYKYGIYDAVNKKFVKYEDGNNRITYDTATQNKIIVLNDGFIHLPTTNWKGSGIAIPVFSLRTNNSFGTGEFTDLKLLVDWCKQVGMKLIQVLPVNDTTATHTWLDSYPYAAISAFALHPMYINLSKIAGTKFKKELAALDEERISLNNLADVNYEAVLKSKISFIQKIFPSLKKSTFATDSYVGFFNTNSHWLIPYAVFCYLRDEYGTIDFNQWPSNNTCSKEIIEKLASEKNKDFDKIAIHYFIQYHLHLQLKEATQYAHENGIIVKGDIAIGVYRYGADAWEQPELYHMNMQAGAPPDDFAVKGQNWGFPTYNWQRMREDGFAWWKQRFEQMSYYFDAFRIDHILGFFRIWSIPMHAVQGIMGRFVPAIAVNVAEFAQRNIWFDKNRYTKPYVNEKVLWDIFGYDNEYVKNNFLVYDGFDHYVLKTEFDTQRKVEAYFAKEKQNGFNEKIKNGLYDLISNVILFEVEGNNGSEFHFRFAMDSTLSFKYLDETTKHQLQELYVHYFFRRQDDFWMKEAMQKLPALKRVTNMLICGEDLGLVPACVPDMMKQLGLLSLEIQRMPKDPKREFFNPSEAPYLSVVTPSTHDMSTIRGWWEEDKEKINRFYHNELGKHGEAPFYCEAWVNKAIILQHLNSPAMWSIFQMQDILGIDENLRRDNPNDERINVPANPKNYWKYRMHISLEDMLQQTEFNQRLKESITLSGR